MAGYVIERHGYTNAGDLAKDLIVDMLANGFTEIKATGGVDFNKATVTAPFKITLEASGTVDPLNASAVAEKQPWRVMIDVKAIPTTGAPEYLGVYVAGPLQLDGKGASAERVLGGNSVVYTDIIGAVGAPVGNNGSSSPVTIDANGYAIYNGAQSGTQDEITKGLINRGQRIGKNGAANPLSYRLVITNRGFWLGVWEDATSAETSNSFNWVLVQRPVDRTTGAVLTTGKAPVFCVNSSGGLFWQFVVRESDIMRPGARRDATTNSSDSEAIINGENQVSLSEDGKYIVTFPSRLNSSRYRYPHELDMIGITSADVVSQFSDVPLTVYGEASPRSYKALHANKSGNTGMRILVLQQGGGIS